MQDPPAQGKRIAIARRAAARALLSLLAVEARARLLQAAGQFMRRPALFAIIVDPSGQERAHAVSIVSRHVTMSVHRVDTRDIQQGDLHRENFRRLLEAAHKAGVILFLDHAEALFDADDDQAGAPAPGRFDPQFLLGCLDEASGVVIAAVRERSAIPALLLVRARFVVDFTVPTDQMRLDLTPERE
jgi:hypothetical protein